MSTEQFLNRQIAELREQRAALTDRMFMLENRIMLLEHRNAALTEALRRIATGTTDVAQPFRYAPDHVLREMARDALKQREGEGRG